MNIIWLHPTSFSGGLHSVLQNYMRQTKINPFDITFKCITGGCIVKQSKTKVTWKKEKLPYFNHQLNALSPDLIVVNDKAALGYVTGKYISLALCRGGVHLWTRKDGVQIPCIVIDDIYKTKSTKPGGWILLQDLQKLRRWIYGKQRHEPRFEYTVIRSISELYNFTARTRNGNCTILSNDIETSGRGKGAFITCSGYTLLEKSGRLHTYVVPFFDGSKSNGRYWENTEDEVLAWKELQLLHMSDIPKTFQNGTYDNTHLLRCRLISNNWYLDTINFMHAMFPEARKSLDFISSLCLDYYQFWKDEGKEDENENTKGKDAVPETPFGMENYWRYNALDCHNTLLSTLFYLQIFNKPQLEWARFNYCEEIEQVTGPAFRMSMTGVKVNTKLKAFFSKQNLAKSNAAYKDLTTMVGDPEFLPSSPKQVASLIYDVLRASQIPRKKRSTNEQILKLIQTQGPLLDIIIEQLWETKKPANNVAKYGNYEDNLLLDAVSEDTKKKKGPKGLWLWNDKTDNARWLYKMNGTGTETWRYKSAAHDLWIGTQIQNPPYSIRPMVEADPGFLLFDIDYSQSDAYFTAFSLEEKAFIETMLSPHDTHCIHAAFFFRRDFNELVAAHKKNLDWCSHNITGVRSITKRVVYGANYLMAGFTLFITMGKEAVIAAAIELGHADAGSWDYSQLVHLCTSMLDSYFELYPGIKPALQGKINHATNSGNKLQCAFGKTRTFFGNLSSDNSSQRELAAFIGQGGTAGNINKALCNLHYGELGSEPVMLLYQLHDSIIGQIPKNRLDLLPKIQAAMENPCELHGRTFTVPTEAKIGFGWGKRMIDFEEGKTTLSAIEQHDKEWFEKNYYAHTRQQ